VPFCVYVVIYQRLRLSTATVTTDVYKCSCGYHTCQSDKVNKKPSCR